MFKVIIKLVGRKHVLDDVEYDWITSNLGKPLEVFSMMFSAESNVPYAITVRVGNEHNDVVTLFVDSNVVKYEFVGTFVQAN